MIHVVPKHNFVFYLFVYHNHVLCMYHDLIVLLYIKYSFPPMHIHAGFLGYTHSRRLNLDTSLDLIQCADLELLKTFLKYMVVYLITRMRRAHLYIMHVGNQRLFTRDAGHVLSKLSSRPRLSYG